MKANPKKQQFLAAYRETGTVTGAAQAAGIDHSSHYRWLRKDDGYATEFH